MKRIFIPCIFLFFSSSGSSKNEQSAPVNIQWVKNLPGDFSFTKNWSFPLGVETKSDGRAGCADGGFCPPRCYNMIDSNGIVFKDSSAIFYKLLDTTHRKHSISCDAWCYEFAGADFIQALRINSDTVICKTETGIATHCSLNLVLTKKECFAKIIFVSIIPDNDAVFYSTSGFIKIAERQWKRGILKAEFNFIFKNTLDPEKPVYWKGKILSDIRNSGKI